MDYIRFSIQNPVKVSVCVLLLLLFGFIALFTIPIQLVPNVDQPIITVQTSWVGRSPEEVEREIIEKQEDKLKGVSSLKKMSATASQGQAEIKLEFFLGTSMNRALQEVSDSLREVPQYAADVDQPVVAIADAAAENAIAWMVLTSEDPTFDVQGLFNETDKRVKPYLERVPGLAQVNIYGGRDREVHIQVNPTRLAERGITFNQLARALQMENVNISAGDLPEGRLDLRVRTVGQYETLDAVRETIIAYSDGGPVRVREVAEVTLTLQKRRAFVHSRGQNGMAINAIRETGANVVTVMHGLRQRVADVNRDILPGMGPKLKLKQVYDETVYIYDALQLVQDNLWQGGVLTVFVLLIFLRRSVAPTLTLIAAALMVAGLIGALMLPESPLRIWSFVSLVAGLVVLLISSPPTGIISLAIPISVIGTFVALVAFGRNLNVVSLAGLAFAIGMVVDNAIVVLENTDRHLAMGKEPMRASYDGTKEVWAAMLASTLTTLVVFLPVLTIREEAGQLFMDISLAICAAVALSLVVAITVIPCAASRWLKPDKHADKFIHRQAQSLMGLAPLLDRFNTGLANTIYWLTGSWFARIALTLIFAGGSIYASYLLMPPTDYLPKGNRNLVFGIMLTPPAYSIEQGERMAGRMESKLRPFWEATSYDDTHKLPAITHPFTGQPVAPIAPVENFFFVQFNGQVFYGASSLDKENVAPLTALLPWSASDNPGVIPFAFQVSLFGRGLGASNSVEVEIAGTDLNEVRDSASNLYLQLIQKYSPFGVQQDPLNFNLAGPELKVEIDRVRAADLAIDVASLGLGVQALVDGVKIGDYRYKGDSIDLLMVRDPALPLTPESLGATPVAIAPENGGGTISLSEFAKIFRTTSPQRIKRIEQLRAVTLTVSAPDGVPLEQVTNDISAMIKPMRESGQIAKSVDIEYAGTADKLIQVRESFLGKWHGFTDFRSYYSLITSRMFLALLVCYLVMAAVFESYLYPFVIIFTVPLATVGGFLGLRIVHHFIPDQLLDVVTMLGFVILIGTAVNNSILIVAQALNFMQGFGESAEDKLEKKLNPREAIRESVRTRMRPVLMTTVTTLLGMLPLVVKPGSGSELYRGLGSVVLGGLLVSTIFTLIVTPMVFSIVLSVKIAIYRKLGWPMREMGEGEALV